MIKFKKNYSKKTKSSTSTFTRSSSLYQLLISSYIPPVWSKTQSIEAFVGNIRYGPDEIFKSLDNYSPYSIFSSYIR